MYRINRDQSKSISSEVKEGKVWWRLSAGEGVAGFCVGTLQHLQTK